MTATYSNTSWVQKCTLYRLPKNRIYGKIIIIAELILSKHNKTTIIWNSREICNYSSLENWEIEIIDAMSAIILSQKFLGRETFCIILSLVLLCVFVVRVCVISAWEGRVWGRMTCLTGRNLPVMCPSPPQVLQPTRPLGRPKG